MNGAAAQVEAEWHSTLAPEWPSIRFGTVTVCGGAGVNVISSVVYLGSVNPGSIRVELYADGSNGGGAERQDMDPEGHSTNVAQGLIYSASVSPARPASDYTARIAPRFPGLAIRLGASEILWQR